MVLILIEKECMVINVERREEKRSVRSSTSETAFHDCLLVRGCSFQPYLPCHYFLPLPTMLLPFYSATDRLNGGIGKHGYLMIIPEFWHLYYVVFLPRIPSMLLPNSISTKIAQRGKCKQPPTEADPASKMDIDYKNGHNESSSGQSILLKDRSSTTRQDTMPSHSSKG